MRTRNCGHAGDVVVVLLGVILVFGDLGDHVLAVDGQSAGHNIVLDILLSIILLDVDRGDLAVDHSVVGVVVALLAVADQLGLAAGQDIDLSLVGVGHHIGGGGDKDILGHAAGLAGCDGYVLKDSDSETLKKAIFDVYNGETFIEPSLTVLLNSSLAERDVMKDKLSELTKREVEVLKLIASGMFNKEIASTLCISERTVKNHVSNIFKKIEVSDRTQAAVFAIKNNLVDIK